MWVSFRKSLTSVFNMQLLAQQCSLPNKVLRRKCWKRHIVEEVQDWAKWGKEVCPQVSWHWQLVKIAKRNRSASADEASSYHQTLEGEISCGKWCWLRQGHFSLKKYPWGMVVEPWCLQVHPILSRPQRQQGYYDEANTPASWPLTRWGRGQEREGTGGLTCNRQGWLSSGKVWWRGPPDKKD